jgi:hypothetical protein
LGTRADAVSSPDEAFPALKKKLKALYKKNSLIEVFFISNQTLRGVSELAEGLVQICIDQAWKSYLGIEEIRPVSYLAIEEAAKEASKQRDHPSMPWDEVRHPFLWVSLLLPPAPCLPQTHLLLHFFFLVGSICAHQGKH